MVQGYLIVSELCSARPYNKTVKDFCSEELPDIALFTESTIIHEVGHWANDAGSWFGNLDPSLKGFGDNITTFGTYFDDPGRVNAFKLDGPYGYMAEIILYDEIRY